MRSLLLLPLLSLLSFGCSQNPHVDIASQPVHATNASAATTPSHPADPTSAPLPPTTPLPQPDVDVPPFDPSLPDRDGDGVPDIYDKCPDVPGQIFNDGCPIDPPMADRDGDGVPDIYDKCPDEPGPAWNDGCPVDHPRPFPPVNHGGCPYPGADDEAHRVLLEVKESLKFDFDRTAIKPESLPALRKLVGFLRRYPLSHLYMVGHADDRGTDAYNISLSFGRVYSVKDFLVKAGIDPRRVSVDARGKREPLISIAGKEGEELDYARMMNRRVDMEVHYEVVER